MAFPDGTSRFVGLRFTRRPYADGLGGGATRGEQQEYTECAVSHDTSPSLNRLETSVLGRDYALRRRNVPWEDSQ